ncbi:integrin alpha-4 isoform X2 [Denticeps clupeoides]|uniref:Integrin alpha-2 domain-containing protein n=1 Tax=Denticeps clupeoides TaxID=299321 RepID=A0AAY4EW70_9TELE|nr:integrin alpha-4 isoform X2 [Denticeps clupeoides]
MLGGLESAGRTSASRYAAAAAALRQSPLSSPSSSSSSSSSPYTSREEGARRGMEARVRDGRMFLGEALCLCYLWSFAAGYNLDVDGPLQFRGPNGSLFGYTVLLHRAQQQTWLLVGAPVADSSFSRAAKKPGAVYKCSVTDGRHCEQLPFGHHSCGKTCYPEDDNQWMGVSLSRRPDGGDVVACGHRWKNVFYSKQDNQNKLPHGVCYKFTPDLTQSRALTPCYRDHQRKFGEDYGSCQAGISNFQTKDLIIMGAPGTSYWTGSVLVYNTSSNVVAAYLDDDSTVQYGSYLGYAVSAGHFLHRESMEIVGGAPQHGQTGRAYVFSMQGNLLSIINTELKGTKLGSYYGASVCAIDLNSDGLSDLLVGAPMYSSVREEGRVHVYINQGNANLTEAKFVLVGRDSYAARFGETIANLGDIDNDGFPDVAVGAPQEDDLQGAIYIYNGRKNGITRTFSQRITGADLGSPLKMFGQSVSGLIDIDGNGYQDVAVGAFLSDSAVVLRTRPVVKVEAFMLLPDRVNRTIPQCRENGQPTVCVNVSVCFRVTGRPIGGRIEMRYNLTADAHHKEAFPLRFYFHGNGTSNITVGRVKTKHNELTCETHQAFMRKDVRDIFTPIYFEVTYELGEHSTARSSSRTLPALKPILQQRGENSNVVTNKTEFARYCAWENCSTNLQVFAHLVLPQSYNNMPYFALGNGKTIMLNTTLVNAGDDAFLPMLHLRFPSNLHYIKVLDAEEKYVSCDITEESKSIVGLDCSVGNLYIGPHAKVNISFLLDVNQNSSAGNVSISINATSDSFEQSDLLNDNFVTVSLPLRYAVDFSVHGYVSPTSFVFGDPDLIPIDCYAEKFNYTYKVVNTGLSKALSAQVEILFPQTVAPHTYRLLRVAGVQTSHGECFVGNESRWTDDECEVPESSFLSELFFFFSKRSKREMFCSPGDSLCLPVRCAFGDLDVGKEVTLQVEVELNPMVLQLLPGRHSLMLMESLISITSPRPDANVILLQDHISASVALEAYFDQKPHPYMGLCIIVGSLIFGLIILSLLILVLWKAGFFKRELKKKQEEERRDSWDYVSKRNSVI